MLLDLHILLIGLVSSSHPNVFSVANGLVGQQIFHGGQWQEKQQGSVLTEDGRRLHVTYLPSRLLREATHVNLSMYHAVVVIMAFDGSSGSFWCSTGVINILSQGLGKSFIQKNCVVVLTGGEEFIKSQSEGRVAGSFTDYCKKTTIMPDNLRDVFHGVQERWLLFDTKGSPDVLNRQREELVDVIDSQVMAARRKQLIDIDIHLARLEQKVLAKTAELKHLIEEMRLESFQWDVIKWVAAAISLMIILTRLLRMRRPVRRGT